MDFYGAVQNTLSACTSKLNRLKGQEEGAAKEMEKQEGEIAELPEFDVLVTNPPFGEDHVDYILRFAATSGKPWLILLPNYYYARPSFSSSIYPYKQGTLNVSQNAFSVHTLINAHVNVYKDEIAYVVPLTKYKFTSPKRLRPNLTNAQVRDCPFCFEPK